MSETARYPQPEKWRLVAGFALTPLMVPFLAFCNSLAVSGLRLENFEHAAGIARTCYVPALCLGLPLYLLVHRLVFLSWWVCMLAAGAVGGAVGLVLDLALNSYVSQPLATRALIYLATVGAGAIHGLVFWLIVVFRDRSFSTTAPKENLGGAGGE